MAAPSPKGEREGGRKKGGEGRIQSQLSVSPPLSFVKVELIPSNSEEKEKKEEATIASPPPL